jgi:uncharacterized iron-regulated membrane protein
MGQNDWERKGRLLHRWLGIASVGFLFLSVVTGLLWANARFLYWQDQYKEKLHPLPVVPVNQAVLPLSAVVERVPVLAGTDAVVDQLTLKSDFGLLLYDVRIHKNKAKQALLLDAVSGEPLSPISEDLASRIARQYVRGVAAVTQVRRESYTPRKKHATVDAIRVSFDDSDETEIVLDLSTGDILEDEGRWRRVHFLVMQVHQLNFWGFEKTLLNIPGIPLLLMGVSGAFLWWLQWRRARRARQALQLRGASGDKVLTTASEL